MASQVEHVNKDGRTFWGCRTQQISAKSVMTTDAKYIEVFIELKNQRKY